MANGFHILIVEDDQFALDVLQTMLETEYRVSSACTVEEAHAILRRSHIDVALITRFSQTAEVLISRFSLESLVQRSSK